MSQQLVSLPAEMAVRWAWLRMSNSVKGQSYEISSRVCWMEDWEADVKWSLESELRMFARCERAVGSSGRIISSKGMLSNRILIRGLVMLQLARKAVGSVLEAKTP